MKNWKMIVDNFIIIFMLGAFVGMGYLIHYLGNNDLKFVNHYYAIFGGLGVWTCCIAIMRDISKLHAPCLQAKLPRVLLYILIAVSIIGGVITSIALIMGPGFGKIDFSKLNVLLCYNQIFLALTIICSLSLHTFFRVAEGIIVVVNGRIYYPGDMYILLPFIVYATKVLSSNIALSIDELTVVCKDARFNAKIMTSLCLDIEVAEMMGLKFLDYKRFEVFAASVIGSVFLMRAENMSGGELLSLKMPPANLDVQIPFVWGGEYEFQFIKQVDLNQKKS